jgi:DNA-directed RNA polymerase specialized sigma24 family protein
MPLLQRRRVESFLVEARPWALRQARKKYPHLPSDLYEDVYQQACVEMLRGNPRATDRPGLYAYLSRVLTGVLGRAHKQWCHQHIDLDDEDNPVELADTSSFAPDDAADNRQLGAVLNELMNRRLLAPERAVLQLQIGVGLDPDQVKVALGMSDRQYKRRRYEGVQKLRESLEDYVNGRVCDEHAERIALAATGELGAGGLAELNAHLAHCGACRAQVRDLRRTVRGRFALAPWPLLLGTPGALAVKAGAIAATLKGAGSGAGLFGGTKVAAATVAATAALAGGAVVVTSADEDVPEPVRKVGGAAPAAIQPAAITAGTTPAKPAAAKKKAATVEKKRRPAAKRPAQRDNATAPAAGGGSAGDSGSNAGQSAPAATSSPSAGAQAPASAGDPVKQVTETVGKTVDTVRNTTNQTVDTVQETLPVVPPPVQETVDKVQKTVDDVLAPLGGGG